VPKEALSNSLSTVEMMERRKISVQKLLLKSDLLEFVLNCSYHACIHDICIYPFQVHGQIYKSYVELDGISTC